MSMCEIIMAISKTVNNQMVHCDVWIVITEELHKGREDVN